jgi:hypothetical protein
LFLSAAVAQTIISDFLVANRRDALHAVEAAVVFSRQHRPVLHLCTTAPSTTIAPRWFRGLPVIIDHRAASEPLTNARKYVLDRARMLIGRQPKNVWPGLPGSAIQFELHDHAGTLGCYATRIGGSASVAPTCAHVLPDAKAHESGGRVITSSGVLRDSFLGSFVPNTASSYDVATVEVTRTLPNLIVGHGKMAKPPVQFSDIDAQMKAKHYPAVVMRGATSGLSFGEAIGFRTALELGMPLGPLFLEVRPTHRRGDDAATNDHSVKFCRRGDSGAILCMAETNRPIGLVCRRVVRPILTHGLAQSISEILTAANLKLRERDFDKESLAIPLFLRYTAIGVIASCVRPFR